MPGFNIRPQDIPLLIRALQSLDLPRLPGSVL